MRKWEVGIGDMACEIRKPEFGIVEQESDESLYWLDDELVAICTTIGKKSK